MKVNAFKWKKIKLLHTLKMIISILKNNNKNRIISTNEKAETRKIPLAAANQTL